MLEVKKECEEDEERKKEERKPKTRGRDRGVFELDFLACDGHGDDVDVVGVVGAVPLTRPLVPLHWRSGQDDVNYNAMLAAALVESKPPRCLGHAGAWHRWDTNPWVEAVPASPPHPRSLSTILAHPCVLGLCLDTTSVEPPAHPARPRGGLARIVRRGGFSRKRTREA